MTEIIYLDIDGTLRDEQEGIPDSAVLAIQQCRKYGIQIVICTGRNPGSIQDDVMALPTDGIISGGGCYIQFRGEEFWKRHFSMDLLKKVIAMSSNGQLSLVMEGEWKIYMDHDSAAFYWEDFQNKIRRRSERDKELIHMRNKIAYEDNLSVLWHEDKEVHKICILGKQNDVDEAEKELIKEAAIVQKKEWNKRWYLEILPKGCDKGNAIRWLNRKLGISKKNSMSFGDSENDIAMMKETGIAVAMENGSPAIRRYASSMCEAVTKDGIYKELVRRGIIKPIYMERRIGNESILVAGRSCVSDLSKEFL